MEDNIIEEDLASKSKNVFKKLSKFEEKVVQNKKQFNSEKDYKDVINRIESVKQKVQAMKNVDGTDEKVLVKHSEYLESISKELKAINKKTLKLGIGAGLAAAGTGIATGLATKKAGNKSFANRSKEFMNEENYFNY